MKIHLTNTNTAYSGQFLLPLVTEKKADHLLSYAHRGGEKHWATIWGRLQRTSAIDLRPRLIIDSGAFTAFTTGKAVHPRDYALWALEFKERWQDKMRAIYFMNLDVIGDQAASWVNQEKLEAMGLKVIPIVTFGADKEHLIRAIENYDYIALGGLVPYVQDKKKLKSWLDFCFSFICARYKRTDVMPRVHLLGITTDWVIKRYPCYSSDSSTWTQCLRFGDGYAAGIAQAPRYKTSDGAMAATLHILRMEIRKYKNMEQDATKMWEKRGIAWDE